MCFQRVELRRTALIGELGLDGWVRPVRGVLPAWAAAKVARFLRAAVFRIYPGSGRTTGLTGLCSWSREPQADP